LDAFFKRCGINLLAIEKAYAANSNISMQK
jgi:hypothetical protein